METYKQIQPADWFDFRQVSEAKAIKTLPPQFPSEF